jgi:hypothetical protein
MSSTPPKQSSSCSSENPSCSKALPRPGETPTQTPKAKSSEKTPQSNPSVKRSPVKMKTPNGENDIRNPKFDGGRRRRKTKKVRKTRKLRS